MDPDEQDNYEEKDIELNQAGRPKQVVILYELTQQMKLQASEQLSKDITCLSEEEYHNAENNTQKVWDSFYKFHKCNFFKDRTYLEREMPEISFFRKLYEQTGKVSNYYELGCGVGNTLFPLLRDFPCFNYYGCDISNKAIQLIHGEMQKHEELKSRLKVEVCDLVKDDIPYKHAGDLNSLIFVLSAIVPEKHQYVMQKLAQSMKPGSFLFFRDYGRYDFGQLNLASKGNRKLRDNFYRKNDGVCVYYFEEKELEALANNVGLKTVRINLHCKLLQNRKTGLKMYRVWIQGRFFKPPLGQFFQERLRELAQQEQQHTKQKQGEGEIQSNKPQIEKHEDEQKQAKGQSLEQTENIEKMKINNV